VSERCYTTSSAFLAARSAGPAPPPPRSSWLPPSARWSPSSATARSLFSVPSSAIWVQRRYDAPALTIIYDNSGWQGPKFSTLAVHPDGIAADCQRPDCGNLAPGTGR
jgi:hypothetical protein